MPIYAQQSRIKVGQNYGELGGLLFLYDANSLNSLADGLFVDTWTDSTERALQVTAAGAARPTFSKNTDGYGNSSLRFAGAQTMSGTIPSFDQPFTLFTVVKVDNVVTLQYIFDGQSLDKVPAVVITSSWRVYAGTILNSSGSPVAGQTFIGAGIYNGASSTNYLDGTATAGAIGSNTGITAVRLGASGGTTSYLTGNIFLIGAFKGALTAEQMLQLNSMLSNRFNIATA